MQHTKTGKYFNRRPIDFVPKSIQKRSNSVNVDYPLHSFGLLMISGWDRARWVARPNESTCRLINCSCSVNCADRLLCAAHRMQLWCNDKSGVRRNQHFRYVSGVFFSGMHIRSWVIFGTAPPALFCRWLWIDRIWGGQTERGQERGHIWRWRLCIVFFWKYLYRSVG